MQIYPIKTEADYRRALAEIEPYFDNPPPDTDPVWDSVDVMATLIEAWERRHHRLADAATAADAIRFCIDQKGMTLEDFVPCIGTLERVRDVLEGRRGLTLPMIRKLHAAFDIPLEVLVRA